jgi:hypothetical protein
MSADDAGAGSPKVPRTEMSRYGGLSFAGQGPVLPVGFALFAAGVAFLFLSDAVVHGWWLGTLQAFGVAFIVGGLTGVLAASGLNQAMREEQEARDKQAALHRRRAEEILARLPPGDVERMLHVLRDDTIDPADRVAVLQRLSWKERDALLNRLEEVDPEQYEDLWPQVYLVRP